MSDSSQSSAEIQAELEEELEEELERLQTTVIMKPEAKPSTISGLVVMAIFSCVAVLAGTGALMSLTYAPNIEDANASVAWYSAGVFGQMSRAAHFHASNLLIVLCASYLGWLVWNGLFRRPAHMTWYRAAMLLGLVAIISLTGQLLPMDQFALHGTNIRLGYLAETPVLGPWLRELAQGGESIGTATLTRFYALHIILLPTILFILLRFLGSETKNVHSTSILAGVALATFVIIFVTGAMFPAPLGLAGDLSESYPEARPEWFALPLYQMLKWLPTDIVLFVPPLLGGAIVFALPIIESAQNNPPKFLKIIRIKLIATALGGGILAAIPMFSDMNNETGYFVAYDVEDVMTAMGKRNDSLLNSEEILPDSTPTLSRDMRILHQRLKGNYPEDISDKEKTEWDKWAEEGAELSYKLRFASDTDSQRDLRNKLREVCESCHEAHDEEIDLNPLANVRVIIREVRVDVPVEPVGGLPPLKPWFDLSEADELKANKKKKKKKKRGRERRKRRGREGRREEGE
ncbi:MAG: cytochrome b N-terminal domain-containing protein, partial [Planctomycetes bacterium]|nr:cytochrome b N-terminal domain-containing protein [Planctomycetota bacterium]